MAAITAFTELFHFGMSLSSPSILGAFDSIARGNFSDLKDPVVLGILSSIVAAAITLYFLVASIKISGISKLLLRAITVFSAVITTALFFGVAYRRTKIIAYNYVYEALFSAAFLVLFYSTWYFYKLAMETKQIRDFENGISWKDGNDK